MLKRGKTDLNKETVRELFAEYLRTQLGLIPDASQDVLDDFAYAILSSRLTADFVVQLLKEIHSITIGEKTVVPTNE